MNKTPRRYEKADAHTIRIIVEKEDNIPIAQLIETRLKLIADNDRAIKVIANIDEMLAKAKELGIVPAPDKKIVPVPKKTENKKIRKLHEGTSEENPTDPNKTNPLTKDSGKSSENKK